MSAGKWISKALQMGAVAALQDTYHRPKQPVITEEAKAWVVHLACSTVSVDEKPGLQAIANTAPDLPPVVPAGDRLHRSERPLSD